MPFRYPSDPEERRREMHREDVFVWIMTALAVAAVALATLGILETL